MVMSFRIRGEIDVEQFRAAFQALVDRSEALRTTIADRDGEPCQRIHHRFLTGLISST